MSKFYIIDREYNPGSAPTNRLLAYLKNLEENGIKTHLVYLYPNKSLSKIKYKYDNIEILYLWDRPFFRNYYVPKLLSSFLITRLVKKVKQGDKIFLFGVPDVLKYVVDKKGVEVYHERTEHPNVIKVRNKKQQELYLKNCPKLDGLFVISTALKDYFQGIGVANDKIEIINMTVDLDRFENIVKQSVVEKYIAYCGTTSNNKDGVDDLIKSFALVHHIHPEIKLYIIGSTPSTKETANNLSLARDLGVIDSIVLTGRISAEQMPQMLKNAEALVLARPDSLQAQNGFPTKLGEYLLTKNPVIVTKVGDIPLFLKDGESALLAEQRNTREIAEKICWVLENPKEASEIGRRGAEVAKKCFNSTIETQKIIKRIFNL